MKSPNLSAIRAELPRGSISAIAEKIGINPKKVTEYFHNGWHQQYGGAILAEAVEIIKQKYPDEDILGEIEGLGLSGGYNRHIPKPKRSFSASRENSSTLVWLLGIAGIAVGAYFAVPEVRQFIDGNILGKKSAVSAEEAQALKVQEAAKPK